MTTSFDLVILGGGCAGLSLATQLIQSNSTLSVLVLERRSIYIQDRTWCYFGDKSMPRADAQHRWLSMRVSSNCGEVVVDCSTSPYEMINAAQFYKNAQKLIDQSNLVNLQLGTNVIKSPEKYGDLWQITTDNNIFQSRYIVDTRPVDQPRRGGAKLWQSFYGAEIECEFDTFNVSCGDLMDFSAADACGCRLVLPKSVCFVYVLPTSTRKALIEFTVFGLDPLTPVDLEKLLQQAITQRLCGTDFKVIRRECGVLPMGTRSTKSFQDFSYVTAGLTAGGARPSSGYAFARIQNWALSCAESLRSGNGPVKHAQDSYLQKFMDGLFLKLVRSRPDLAPDLFVALFAGTKAPSVIRFLSDRASLTDYMRVIASLLPGPLLRALFVRKAPKANSPVPEA